MRFTVAPDEAFMVMASTIVISVMVTLIVKEILWRIKRSNMERCEGCNMIIDNQFNVCLNCIQIPARPIKPTPPKQEDYDGKD